MFDQGVIQRTGSTSREILKYAEHYVMSQETRKGSYKKKARMLKQINLAD